MKPKQTPRAKRSPRNPKAFYWMTVPEEMGLTKGVPPCYPIDAVQRRFQNSVIAVLLILAVGGHWAFLQGVAWTGMVFRYSQTDTVAVAISKTFDGKHPCGLCKVVSHGKRAEKEQHVVKSEVKLTWMCSMLANHLWAPGQFMVLRSGDEHEALTFESPAIPPPRLI